MLAAIYAAFGTAWDEAPGADAACDLAEEAIFLARLLVALLPDEPECKGLLALMLYCEARRPARRDAGGAYRPLAEQDPALWSQAMIAEAEALLRAAAAAGRFGRYQTEAALQSLHVVGRLTGRADPAARVALYDLLLTQAQSIGAQVARAAALAEAHGPAAALSALDAIGPAAATYQPAWATRAHCLALLGDTEAAAQAYDRAIGLSHDPAVRAFLTKQCAARSARGPATVFDDLEGDVQEVGRL